MKSIAVIIHARMKSTRCPQKHLRDLGDGNTILDIALHKVSDLKNVDENRNTLVQHYSWDKTAETYESIFDSIELTGLQGKWDSPHLPISEDTNINVSENNRESVGRIISDIVQSPYLLRTAMVQAIIQNLDNGFVMEGGNIKNYDFAEAGKLLDQIYNAKKTWEGVRTGKLSMPEVFKEVITY